MCAGQEDRALWAQRREMHRKPQARCFRDVTLRTPATTRQAHARPRPVGLAEQASGLREHRSGAGMQGDRQAAAGAVGMLGRPGNERASLRGAVPERGTPTGARPVVRARSSRLRLGSHPELVACSQPTTAAEQKRCTLRTPEA